MDEATRKALKAEYAACILKTETAANHAEYCKAWDRGEEIEKILNATKAA